MSKKEAGGTGGSEKEFYHSGNFVYQVFLSFCGKDHRKKFIDHLRLALEQRGITTFHDDSTLERGEEIASGLIKAIETSKLSIVTFSPGYATSKWCLNELVKIMECRNSHGHIVLPVFYDMEPTQVRRQEGPYMQAFVKHKDHPNVDKWKNALTSAGELAGFHLQNHANGYEAQFIKYIIADVVEKVDDRLLNIPKHMTGAKTLVEYINWWLHNDLSDKEIVIVYGPISKITNTSQKAKDVVLLREGNVMVSEVEVSYNVNEHTEMINEQYGRKKIPIALDDVKQLLALLDHPEWFLPGSRVMIIVRKQHLLNANGARTVKFHVRAQYVDKELPYHKSQRVLKWSFDSFDKKLLQHQGNSFRQSLQNHRNSAIQEHLTSIGESVVELTLNAENQLNSMGESIVQQIENLQNQLNNISVSIQLRNVGDVIVEQTESLQNQLNRFQESVKHSVQEVMDEHEETESLQNLLTSVGEVIVEQAETLLNHINSATETIEQSCIGEAISEKTEILQNQLNSVIESIQEVNIEEVISQQTESLENELNSIGDSIIRKTQKAQNRIKGWFSL